METSPGFFGKRQVGLVVEPSGPEGASLGPALRLWDALTVGRALPFETTPVTQPSALLGGELAGVLLSPMAGAQAWLRELAGPVTLAAPFQTPGTTRSSLLVWAFEEAARTRVGRGTPGEAWIETTQVSRLGLETAIQAAASLARERDATPVWAYVGWGEAEEQAVASARKILSGSDFRVVPLEQLHKEALDRAYPKGSVILCSARTAPPLARWLETQGWVAWTDAGGRVAQPAGVVGAGLTVALFLDRLGFPAEARELERAVAEAIAHGGVEGYVERVAGKFSSGADPGPRGGDSPGTG